MAIVDRHGLALAVSIASASPHETQLVEATLEQRFLPETPERMIGDLAYDSEKLDEHLLDNYATEMIAPHKAGRVSPPTQETPNRRFRFRTQVKPDAKLLSNLSCSIEQHQCREVSNFIAPPEFLSLRAAEVYVNEVDFLCPLLFDPMHDGPRRLAAQSEV